MGSNSPPTALAPGEDALVELMLAGRLAYEDGQATFRQWGEPWSLTSKVGGLRPW